MNALTEKQIEALCLIDGRANTDLSNVLISRQAKSLLEAKLIDYAPKLKVAYALTKSGKEAIHPKS